METRQKIDIYCPRCTNKISVREGIKILSCFTCGLEFEVESPNKIGQFFYRSFARIKSLLPNWFRTNWQKFITTFEKKIISETIIYESHCWFCKSPIKSVKLQVKSKNFIRYKLGQIWFGNKKCTKKNCNYFICNNCGRCLCDWGDDTLKKASVRIERDWIKENPDYAK